MWNPSRWRQSRNARSSLTQPRSRSHVRIKASWATSTVVGSSGAGREGPSSGFDLATEGPGSRAVTSRRSATNGSTAERDASSRSPRRTRSRVFLPSSSTSVTRTSRPNSRGAAAFCSSVRLSNTASACRPMAPATRPRDLYAELVSRRPSRRSHSAVRANSSSGRFPGSSPTSSSSRSTRPDSNSSLTRRAGPSMAARRSSRVIALTLTSPRWTPSLRRGSR